MKFPKWIVGKKDYAKPPVQQAQQPQSSSTAEDNSTMADLARLLKETPAPNKLD